MTPDHPTDAAPDSRPASGRLINEQHCERCGKIVNTFDSGILHAAHDCHTTDAPRAGGPGTLPDEVEVALTWIPRDRQTSIRAHFDEQAERIANLEAEIQRRTPLVGRALALEMNDRGCPKWACEAVYALEAESAAHLHYLTAENARLAGEVDALQEFRR